MLNVALNHHATAEEKPRGWAYCCCFLRRGAKGTGEKPAQRDEKMLQGEGGAREVKPSGKSLWGGGLGALKTVRKSMGRLSELPWEKPHGCHRRSKNLSGDIIWLQMCSIWPAA